MNVQTKKILVVGCVSLLVLATVAVVGGYLAYQRFSPVLAEALRPSRLEMPSDIETPSVIVGSGFVSKSIFLEAKRVGSVTDIVVGELDPSPGVEIGVAGSEGAVFVDEGAKVKSSVIFFACWPHVDIIDVDGDGTCEFMNRGSWATPASLIDHNGNKLWSYGRGMPGIDDMAAGDIDGDGALEFVVGFNGGGGVHLLETDGKKQWRQPDGNVWHVEIVDTNGDGSLEIVHSNARGEIKVRDAQGKVISRANPAPYISAFSLCKWPTKKDREYVLLAENDTIWLFDFSGKCIAELEAPRCGTLGHARGVPVRIKGDEPEHFAVVVEFWNWERTVLYIYDPAGTLVYQEILPEACAAIASVSLDDSEAETLLIGGQGKVWQYKAGNETNT